MRIKKTTSEAARNAGRSSIEAQIDSVFARWNSPRSPGYAVGVVRSGKLIFAKGYGMANLEYGVPITPRSPFYIGSMSKQFTAACAALLVQRGKLRLTDDARRYIPDLPDYGQRLTIEQLIHHIGGVREWSSPALFAGQDRRFEQHIDNKDVLRLLLRQKSLEFVPGSEFRYSSGGYVLLAAVIERVTGQPLRQFARENLFEPLGMHHTFYDDNYAAIVPGRVESYRRVGAEHFERLLKHFDLYGDGGVITTVEDVARWDANFYNRRIGNKQFIDLLLTHGRLNSGEALPYGFGLEFRQYKGHSIIQHNGFMLQFTADMVRFPKERLSVIVLGNTADRFATEMAYQVADLFLENAAPPRSRAAGGSAPLLSLASEQLEPFTGHYWNGRANFYRRVVLKEAQLSLDWGEGTGREFLVPLGPTKFMVLDQDHHPVEPARCVSFKRGGAGSMQMAVETAGQGGEDLFDRYDPTPPRSLDELKPCVGEYYSEELDVAYRFAVSDGKLTLRIGGGNPVELFPHPDGGVIWNARHMLWMGFGEVIFRKDAAGNVIGFDIGDQRVSAVRFTKVPMRTATLGGITLGQEEARRVGEKEGGVSRNSGQLSAFS